ncbi:hypothetical protein [Glutamicibacter sp. BW78]|uniref:hypothetical protein n=1 Tax=Glutamicibacter sp. BW78 TaxID=2024403 RepID=UPI00117B1953|nr:hypothetical protein [Glutamicibacter sp. BW78]
MSHDSNQEATAEQTAPNVPSAHAGTDEEHVDGGSAKWRTARHLIAAVLLLVLAVGALWFYKDCTVTQSGGVSTRICTPPTVTSAGALLALFTVLMLLWPDLAEITVLGVTLRRKISKAADDAAAADRKVSQVENLLQLQQIRIDSVVSSSSVASASSNNTFHFSGGEWSQQESERLRKYKDAVSPESDGESDSESVQATSNYSEDDLAMHLIREYEELSKLLNIGPYRPNGKGDGYRGGPKLANELRWFAEEQSAVINNVRRLRNSIAHGDRFSREDVAAGIQVVESLLSKAKELRGSVI